MNSFWVIGSLLLQTVVFYGLYRLRAFDRTHPEDALRERQMLRNYPIDLPMAVTVGAVLAAISAPFWLVSHWGVGCGDAAILIAAWFGVVGAPRQG